MKCHLCDHEEKPEPGDQEFADDLNLMVDHIRVMHPDQYEEPERWPDGGIVIHDDTLTPEDFA